MPQTAIAVANLPFPRLYYVKDADAEADIVKDPVRVFFVDFDDKGLFRGDRERGRLDGKRVLLRRP